MDIVKRSQLFTSFTYIIVRAYEIITSGLIFFSTYILFAKNHDIDEQILNILALTFLQEVDDVFGSFAFEFISQKILEEVFINKHSEDEEMVESYNEANVSSIASLHFIISNSAYF